jgi:hypothetical protein
MLETHDHSHRDDKNNALPWRNKVAWIVFAIIAGFYLWTEHRAHLLGVLPYLVLLACPLMHLFMHHGHDHGHGHGGKTPPDKSDGGQS